MLACMSVIEIVLYQLEKWRASIGIFISKCIIKQRVRVNVSTANIYNYMMYFLKWAVSSALKLLSFVYNEIL